MILTQEAIPGLHDQLTLYSRGEGQEGEQIAVSYLLFREGCMKEVVSIRFDCARSRPVTRRDDSHR